MTGMWVAVVLLLTVGGSLAISFYECPLERCEHVNPGPQLRKVGVPNAEELTLICPTALLYKECVHDEIKVCTGHNVSELASSDNKTVSAPFKEILSLGNLVVDICNDSSSIHASYVSGVPCFRQMATQPDNQCREEASAVYEAYKSSTKLTRNEENDQDQEENLETIEIYKETCMERAYTLACLSNQVHTTCGKVARTAYVEILRRLKSPVFDECSESDVLALKTSFLDFLQFEEEKRNVFSELFNALTE